MAKAELIAPSLDEEHVSLTVWRMERELARLVPVEEYQPKPIEDESPEDTGVSPFFAMASGMAVLAVALIVLRYLPGY